MRRRRNVVKFEIRQRYKYSNKIYLLYHIRRDLHVTHRLIAMFKPSRTSLIYNYRQQNDGEITYCYSILTKLLILILKSIDIKVQRFSTRIWDIVTPIQSFKHNKIQGSQFISESLCMRGKQILFPRIQLSGHAYLLQSPQFKHLLILQE